MTVPAVDGVPSTVSWGETAGSAGYLVMSACDTPAFSAAQNDTLDVEVSVQQWTAAPVAADKLDDYRHGADTLYFKSASGTLFCGISSTAAGCVGVLVDAARNTPVADCWEHRAGPAAHRILLHTDEPAEFDCPGDPSFGIDNPDTVAVLPVGSTLAAHGFTCVNTTSSSSERITCRTDAHGFSAGTFLADVDLY